MEQVEIKTESILTKELESLVKMFEKDITLRILDYEELVEIFHQYMPSLIHYSPLNLYTNPLSNFIRYHIGDEVPGCIIEEFQVYEKQEEFKSDMAEIRDYYKSLIDDNAKFSPEELKELTTFALIDANSKDFIKYLLGQIIDGAYPVKKFISNSLVNRYFQHLLATNELKCRSNRSVNQDVDKQFNSRIINSLYDMFYRISLVTSRIEEYTDPSIVEMIKIDDFFEETYGPRFTEENKELFALDFNSHLNATLLLADFLKENSPTTYQRNKKWLIQRANTYTEKLFDRDRLFSGRKYDIDEIFAQTLESTEEKKEDVLSLSDKKVYQKEIKI